VASRGNPEVADSQAVAGKIALQHGDANFDGSIVVSDLAYLVDYLFRGGAQPVPVVEAGDFSCDGSITVSDLSRIVDFLFKGGDSPVCNPY
jgi:hypothetical protein